MHQNKKGQATRNGKLDLRDYKIVKSKSYTGRVHFKSHSPELWVLSRFDVQHCPSAYIHLEFHVDKKIEWIWTVLLSTNIPEVEN